MLPRYRRLSDRNTPQAPVSASIASQAIVFCALVSPVSPPQMSSDNFRPDGRTRPEGLTYFTPKHINKPCLCQNYHVENTTTYSITSQYQQHKLPLISYINDTVELLSDVLHAHCARRYVAISHVRSQGLGNSVSNSLPMCQISRLQSLVNRLYPTISEPVPFWVDTLCIPLTAPGQYLAFEALYDVYRRADNTIVLEESLFNSPTHSAEQNLSKIKDSQWAQRLWTVREGAIAKSLKIQFKNSALDMLEIIRDYSSAKNGGLKPHTGSRNDLDEGNMSRKTVDSFIERLKFLERDLRAALDKIPPPPMSFSYRDLDNNTRIERKNQIRVVLRHCYLSVPLYRYFATESEAARFVLVRATIDSTYKSLTYDAILNQKSSPVETLKRLETIRLQSDVAA